MMSVIRESTLIVLEGLEHLAHDLADRLQRRQVVLGERVVLVEVALLKAHGLDALLQVVVLLLLLQEAGDQAFSIHLNNCD